MTTRLTIIVTATLAATALWATSASGRSQGADSRRTEGSPGPDTLRTLEPEDLFRMHRIGDVRFSPSGRSVAFERIRSGNEGEVDRAPTWRHPRSDVWVSPVGEGEPRPITDGGSDGTGWFHPRWSPDGERLALLSIRGNEIRAWVWERSTGELTRVTDRAVYVTSTEPLVVRWLSPEELALGVRPEGAPGRGRILAEITRPGLFAVRKWRKSWSGRHATGDVLSSGGEGAGAEALPRTEVVVADVDGSSQKVAAGRWGIVRPSPRGRWLATFSDPPVAPVPEDQPLSLLMVIGTRPGAARVDADRTSRVGASGRQASRGKEGRALDSPRYGSLRWAPDGSAYALLTDQYEDADGRPTTRVAVYEPAAGGLHILGRSDLEPADVAWTGDSRLLVRARSRTDSGERARADWWLVPPDGEWRNLTADMSEPPERLVPGEGPAAVGAAAGELWRVDAEGATRVLTEAFEPSIRRIVWPAPSRSPFGGGAGSDRRPGAPLGVVASSSSPGGEPGLWTLDPAADGLEGTARRIPTPDDETRPADLSPEAGAAAFRSVGDAGARSLMVSARGGVAAEREEPGAGTASGGGAVDTLLTVDEWLRNITPGETRELSYRGTGGRELTAWLLLPPGHESGESHPAVVSVYPGRVQRDSPPRQTRPGFIWPVQALQLLAARGYAVLFPSVPLPEVGSGLREHIDDGVLPAVERAVDAGLVDSARVGLMGHSFGGFGVNHLVSLTDRFRAAVSSAGASHLATQYGTFDPRYRHGHMGEPMLSLLGSAAYFETGQGRMGAPPWEVPGRYRRNSPLTHVDEVETPLMMIHGDRDFVPVQQAEAFFTGLWRRNRTARLVRYAGEGHIVRGKANVLDMWGRIFDWFDRYLR